MTQTPTGDTNFPGAGLPTVTRSAPTRRFLSYADHRAKLILPKCALQKALQGSDDARYSGRMPQILIDADACPVKDEIYKVAWRYDVLAIVVSNSPIRVPTHPLVSRVVVSDGFDAADDWIVEHVDAGSVVITTDILLADRCLKAGSGAVIAPNGKPFTLASIGNAVAARAIMADLRAGMAGDALGGPAPFGKADRSRFLSMLDETIVRLRRKM